MSSWLENIKNQHINLMEEEEEEEDQNEVEEKKEEIQKPEIEEKNANEEQAKVEEKQEEANNDAQKKEVKANDDNKVVYEGPNTRETVLFSKSIDKLTSEEEKSYVESLIKIRGSLTSVLGQTSKTLKNGSLLNGASKKSLTAYTALRKSILDLPIPHVEAVSKN